MFRNNYTPHSMRHTTATHMLEAGVPLIDKEKYLLSVEKTSSNNTPGFLEVYSIEEIEDCYEGELAECSNEALESLQYQSYAYYMLFII